MPGDLTTEYLEQAGVLIARPRGNLAGLVDDWAREIEARLRPEMHGLVLNLSEVEFISSRGLGVLLHLHKLMTGRRSRLHLVGGSEAVLDSLEVAGLDTLLFLFPNEAEALAAY
jgi:anti-anti-sigma factor